MIKFTNDTLIIEIKDFSPIEYLFDLQSAILEVLKQINYLELQLETTNYQRLNGFNNANFKLMEFFKELRLTDFNSNPEMHSFIFDTLQDSIKKQHTKEQIKKVNESTNETKEQIKQVQKEIEALKKELATEFV